MSDKITVYNLDSRSTEDDIYDVSVADTPTTIEQAEAPVQTEQDSTSLTEQDVRDIIADALESYAGQLRIGATLSDQALVVDALGLRLGGTNFSTARFRVDYDGHFFFGDAAIGSIEFDGTTFTINAKAVNQDGTPLLQGLSASFFATNDQTSGYSEHIGFSDDGEFAIGMSAASSPSGGSYSGAAYNTDTAGGIGAGFLPVTQSTRTISGERMHGIVNIGGQIFASITNPTVPTYNIERNGTNIWWSAVTDTAQGPLGHDPTNDYLLVLSSTTRISRFSNLAGSLSFVDNITLDTAVTATCGFLFDNDNSQYYCCDKTNNLVRVFDSSGNTVTTHPYSFDDSRLMGLLKINNRIYAAFGYSVGNTTGIGSFMSASFSPMDITVT